MKKQPGASVIGIVLLGASARLFVYRYFTSPVTLTVAAGSIDGEWPENADLALVRLEQAEQAWTGMQNLGSFATLPPQAIERFIRAGARTARREGWLLLDTQIPGAWLDTYRSGYEVAEERRFGDYIAYRLVPR